MRRRNFIAGLGSATFTLPLTAQAQKAERPRRVGVIMNLAADDPEGKIRSDALHNALQEMGWVDGRNLLLDYRWGAGDAGLFRKYAEELVALAPEVILATLVSSKVSLFLVATSLALTYSNSACVENGSSSSRR